MRRNSYLHPTKREALELDNGNQKGRSGERVFVATVVVTRATGRVRGSDGGHRWGGSERAGSQLAVASERQGEKTVCRAGPSTVTTSVPGSGGARARLHPSTTSGGCRGYVTGAPAGRRNGDGAEPGAGCRG